MPKHSAGILLYRINFLKRIEVFLVHPGGPFWSHKDLGAWSIPKGLLEENENPLDAAVREFQEETGFNISGNPIYLGEVKQSGNKIIHCWGLEKDVDPRELVSNTFSLEWPSKSGHLQEFPEIDKAGWFGIPSAREKILKAQGFFIDKLIEKIDYSEVNNSEDFEQDELF